MTCFQKLWECKDCCWRSANICKVELFVSFPAWSHQSFLVMYQTDKPVVLYIYQDIQKIDEVACKAWYVNKCDSISKLKNVPLNNKKFYEN